MRLRPPLWALCFLVAGCQNANPAYDGVGRPDADAGDVSGGDGAASIGPVTPDARLVDGGNRPGDDGSIEARVPVIVAGGEQGLLVASRDLGRTWGARRVTPGELEYVTRVLYVGEIFVALGWKVRTSSDGNTWIERPNPVDNWLGASASGNGWIVAVGGYGATARSRDGATWTAGGPAGSEPFHSIAFGEGVFVAANRAKKTFITRDDGLTWAPHTDLGSDEIAYCQGAFRAATACAGPLPPIYRGHGVWIRLDHDGLHRSEDGRTWTKVYEDAAGIRTIGFGFAPR